jgi:hypothetical protein
VPSFLKQKLISSFSFLLKLKAQASEKELYILIEVHKKGKKQAYYTFFSTFITLKQDRLKEQSHEKFWDYDLGC